MTVYVVVEQKEDGSTYVRSVHEDEPSAEVVKLLLYKLNPDLTYFVVPTPVDFCLLTETEKTKLYSEGIDTPSWLRME